MFPFLTAACEPSYPLGRSASLWRGQPHYTMAATLSPSRETQSKDPGAEVGGSGLVPLMPSWGLTAPHHERSHVPPERGEYYEVKGFMESGERKRNEDNKAARTGIGWGGIRKTDLEITGQEDAAA